MRIHLFKSGLLLLLVLLFVSCKTGEENKSEQHCLSQLLELKATQTTYRYREAGNGDKLRSTVLHFSATDMGKLEQNLSQIGYQPGPMPEKLASRLQEVGVRPENYYYKIVEETEEKKLSLCLMDADLAEEGYYSVSK